MNWLLLNESAFIYLFQRVFIADFKFLQHNRVFFNCIYNI